jgi:hypothetical protein
MKKTLTFSILAATVFGGMLLTLPAQAYDCHHEWRHAYHAFNYNYRHPHFVRHDFPVRQRVWVR